MCKLCNLVHNAKNMTKLNYFLLVLKMWKTDIQVTFLHQNLSIALYSLARPTCTRMYIASSYVAIGNLCWLCLEPRPARAASGGGCTASLPPG